MKLADFVSLFFRLSAITEAQTGIVPEDSLDKVANMEGTRVVKTHLCLDMLPNAIMNSNIKVSIPVQGLKSQLFLWSEGGQLNAQNRYLTEKNGFFGVKKF